MAIDLVAAAQCLFENVQVVILEPVEEGVVAEAVGAGRQQDQRPARFDGVHSVIEGLVRLDEVDVLGVPAAGDDGQVGGPLQGDGIEIFSKLAAGQVRSFQCPAKDPGNPLVCREYRIQDEVRVDHVCRFKDRLVDRVVFQVGRTGPRIAPALLRWIENCEMRGHAGFTACHAWYQAFAPAAEAGEVVQTDGAGDDHPVGGDDAPVDLDRQPGRSHAQVVQLCAIVAFMVIDRDAAEQRAENLAVLRGRLLAVNAEGDHDFDGVVADAAAVQLFDQDRQVNLAAGIAGDVRGNDDDSFAGTDDVGKPR